MRVNQDGERVGLPHLHYKPNLPTARLVYTETVEGVALPLYAHPNSPDQPWPTLSAVRALLNGATYPVIKAGMGLSKVRGSGGDIAIVSPQATAAAVRLALRDGRITPKRAAEILAVLGEG